jgi:hypothetical protein
MLFRDGKRRGDASEDDDHQDDDHNDGADSDATHGRPPFLDGLVTMERGKGCADVG